MTPTFLIPLTQGQFAMVDEEDYDNLSSYKWFAQWCPSVNGFYAGRNARGSTKIHKTRISMHRAITNAPAGMDVDHINRNTLDNRRSNLRVVTRSINMLNGKLNCKNKSGYSGIHQYQKGNWSVSFKLNKRKLWLGRFSTLESALEARNAYLRQNADAYKGLDGGGRYRITGDSRQTGD